MRRWLTPLLFTGALIMGSSDSASGQEIELLPAGEMAPEVEFTGATRHGILADPVRLSDYRGETVVLAFFFKVRTRG